MRINDHEHEAMVSDGAFAVRHGELAFAPGSSGWPMRHGGEVRWMEIFLRGGNAWDLFEDRQSVPPYPSRNMMAWFWFIVLPIQQGIFLVSSWGRV